MTVSRHQGPFIKGHNNLKVNVPKICETKTDNTARRSRKSTRVVIDFSILLLIIDRTGRQQISKTTEDLTNTTNFISLLFPEHFTQQQQNTHSLSASKTFTKINYVLSHKINFSKFKNSHHTKNILWPP